MVRILFAIFYLTTVVAVPRFELPGEITDLPNAPKVDFQMASGYIDVDHGNSLFYWFVTSVKHPATDPVVLWTNGGPGCSGLGGFMTEQGPFRPTKNGSLVLNPSGWNQIANMIFIEQPAGVGFSVAGGNIKYGDEQAANDNLKFVTRFFARYPQFSKNPFFITSESYGGHYMPTLAKKLADDALPNFKGFAVGNPLTYMPFRNFGQYGTYYNHQLLPKPLWEQYTANTCQSNTSDLCTSVTNKMDTITQGLDPYALDFPACNTNKGAGRNERMQLLKTIMHKSKIAVKNLGGYFPKYEACASDWAATYLNRADVQRAIHIANPGSVKWSDCSDAVGNNYNATDVDLPMMQYYKYLIDKKPNVKILVYSGDDDSICATLGTQQWIWDLGYNVKSEWAPWTIDYKDGTGPQTAGMTVEFDGFRFATVHGAGHMVPATRPEAGLEVLRKFLAGEW